MKKTNILLILAFIIFIFGSGYKFGEYNSNQKKVERPAYNILNTRSADQDVKNIDFGLFWETWDKVEEKFIDKNKINPQKMFYGAIKGMVASLEDPYTFFLTPEENKESKDGLDGNFQGIGAQLELKNFRIVVAAPLKNSPAEKAGVKTGDVIIEVDDKSTKNWTLPQAVAKIRGPKGTKVKLKLQRGEKQVEVTITRDEIHVESVELSYESAKNNSKVAYLKINQFGQQTNDEWDRAASQIQSKWKNDEIKGMVLDLRDNPGGFLDSAVYLASEFIPQGQLIVKQESTISDNKDYRVTRTGKLIGIPLTVIINKGSASASEILAGALRDHKKARLIGEKSFGKGSVQEALDLKDNAGLHVTVAKWILPNGDWINGKGIEPEIKVENKVENGNTLSKDKDKQLERAIEEVVR